MVRSLTLVVTAVVAVAALNLARAEEEPPLPQPEEGLEIEPPILIQTRDRQGMPVVPTPTPRPDIAKLEKDLTRAQRGANGADRLYKSGIIAKVEAEERVLRVVRLEAQLAAARLEQLKTSEEQPTPGDLAEAQQAAERAADERHRAEIEMALRNLQRQQKLLALGSGRKADVSRAEKKLAELQGAAPAETAK